MKIRVWIVQIYLCKNKKGLWFCLSNVFKKLSWTLWPQESLKFSPYTFWKEISPIVVERLRRKAHQLEDYWVKWETVSPTLVDRDQHKEMERFYYLNILGAVWASILYGLSLTFVPSAIGLHLSFCSLVSPLNHLAAVCLSHHETMMS